MAFQRLTYSKHYTALSTDVKDVVGIGPGSTCSEVDTGKEFIFSGTAWVQVVSATQLNGSLANIPVERRSRSSITTIINAVSVPVVAGNFAEATFNTDDASEIWVLINIDKQPWSALIGTITIPATPTAGAVFPALDTNQTAAFATYPKVVNFVGAQVSPTSLQDAKNYGLLAVGTNGIKIKVYNLHATDIATLSVKILKVWR